MVLVMGLANSDILGLGFERHGIVAEEKREPLHQLRRGVYNGSTGVEAYGAGELLRFYVEVEHTGAFVVLAEGGGVHGRTRMER